MQSSGPSNATLPAEEDAEAPRVCSLTFTVSNGYLRSETCHLPIRAQQMSKICWMYTLDDFPSDAAQCSGREISHGLAKGGGRSQVPRKGINFRGFRAHRQRLGNTPTIALHCPKATKNYRLAELSGDTRMRLRAGAARAALRIPSPHHHHCSSK